MLILLSPSKTQDFSPPPPLPYRLPLCTEKSELLIQALRKLSSVDIEKLMGVSSKIAHLNHERFASWSSNFTQENSKHALLAFKGDVYSSMDTKHYSTEDFSFADQHIRILSGLYGLLRPLDLIQPYRLEMKTKLKTQKAKDLYAFWQPYLTDLLNTMLQETAATTVINLASAEYFGALEPKRIQARVITPIFKEYRNNTYSTIGLFAKRARGAMADFAIRERITEPRQLLTFTGMGYQFNASLSSEDNVVFTR